MVLIAMMSGMLSISSLNTYVNTNAKLNLTFPRAILINLMHKAGSLSTPTRKDKLYLGTSHGLSFKIVSEILLQKICLP